MKLINKNPLKILSLILITVVLNTLPTSALADGKLMPFVLASTNSGTVAQSVMRVKESFASNGFTVVGEYSPYKTAHIIVVTNATLKKAAASHPRAGYFAALRVSVTKVGKKVQISYSNPAYWAAAYHVKSDVSGVTQAIKKALGAEKTFGSKKGLSKNKLTKYHYAFGMEYFDEPYDLASYADHAQAVAAVEKGLLQQKAGTKKVYRIDMPGTKQTLFGVAMSSAKTNNKFMDDKFIMSVIDFKALRSSAHLPYEILVTGNAVEALHARFRIAISFPDLSMMGDNSFMNIMASPDAIKDSLTIMVGGEVNNFE